jgi:hypothetical protein
MAAILVAEGRPAIDHAVQPEPCFVHVVIRR